MRSHVLAALLFASVAPATLYVAPAAAQSDDDRATARALAAEGQAALDRKDWKTAEDRFSRAESLFHAPTLVLGLARAYVGTGKLVAAQETYNRLIHEGIAPGAPPLFVKALEDAKHEVESVTPRLGTAVLTVTAAGGREVSNPRVTLDDKPVKAAALGVRRVVDPGQHTVKVEADGFAPRESKFTVAEGGAANVVVTLDAAAAAPTPVAPLVAATGPTGAEKPATPPAPAGATATTDAAKPEAKPETKGEAKAETKPESDGSLQKTLGITGMGVAGASAIGFIVSGVLAMGKHSSIANSCGPGGTQHCADPNYASDTSSYNTLGNIATATAIATGVFAAAGLTLYVTAPSNSEAPPKTTATVTPFVTPNMLGVFGSF